ncbi:type 1 glutamine amidotransferase [Aspergillus ibericus CBS 121593]|uniref:Class I glutamine amidotransferase-like protein n=1 Tax=Aspergillus ibericus CBS 121593 TaxID=1448316 RepID=A0A395GQ14_9EURO|nr:hypothetical protein BO80DRAFT_504796 [Aspergillus ibericus CBS 121593]RAK97446.1 hypothetical protein BO80DRAFT_504796 [Aspergillus ibericus CBS 121593]
MRTIHIAILDTDVPVPTIYTTRGLYSTQFHALLAAATTRLNQHSSSEEEKEIRIHTTAYDAVGGHLPSFSSLLTTPSHPPPNPKEEGAVNPLTIPISALLITGSAASVYDPTLPWIPPLIDFLRTVYENYPRVKLFGSCFGHQLIAYSLLSTSSATGAKKGNVRVERCPLGMEIGLARVTLSSGFVDAFPCLKGTKEWRVQMVHGDWVASSLLSSEEGGGEGDALPAPWVNIGSTDQCPIQGLYAPGRVLSYQGHFEFDSVVNRETCVEFGRRLGWTEESLQQYVEAIGEVDGEGDDSKVAAEVVVRFLAGEDEPTEYLSPAEKAGLKEKLASTLSLIGQLISWSTRT